MWVGLAQSAEDLTEKKTVLSGREGTAPSLYPLYLKGNSPLGLSLLVHPADFGLATLYNYIM